MAAYTSTEQQASVTSNRAVWASILLAPLLAGTIAALTNLMNFVADRPAYFAVWGAAHLLAFAFGLWAASLWRRGGDPSAYILLALLAGAVEALIVFGVVDGLTITSARYPGQLVTGVEDYIAAAATSVLFAAGAMHGLRRQRPVASAAAAAPVGRREARAPGASFTQFLTAAGPVITLVAGLLK